MSEHVERAERLLQKWLRLKPLPFYVERMLCRPSEPKSIAFWENLWREMAPEQAELYSMIDCARCSTAQIIAYTNYYAYKQYFHLLDDIVNLSQTAIQLIKPSGPIYEQAKAQECLSYALTERSVGWSEIVSPNAQLSYASPSLVQALEACQKSLQLAVQSGNHFIAHRAAYNIGRIHHNIGMNDSFGFAYDFLMKSFAHLEIYVATNGEPSEPYWIARKAEILQRLVELCALQMSGLIPTHEVIYDLPEFAQFLKDPQLARAVTRRASFQHGDGGAMVWQIDAVKDRTNIPLPLVFDFKEIKKRLNDNTAILDFVLGNKYAIFTLIHKTGTWVKIINPDDFAAGGWDRFFRPTAVDLNARTDLKGPNQTRRITWQFSVPYVELTPKDPDHWTICAKNYNSIYDPNVDWERVLHQILFGTLENQLQRLGVKHLIVVPDGALNLVPFQILQNEQHEFLTDRYSISYAPNTAIVADSLARLRKFRLPESLLIVKDPAQELDFAEWESSQVSKMFPADKVSILDSTNATKENIIAAARDADVIHFCTHGKFDSENPKESGLCIKNGRWLTLDEIRELEIRDGAIVFLSACDTARLKLASRFYSVGICPSFLEAGAATVISTFWKVNDMATALLSSRFYENLIKSRLSRLESLVEASKWVRQMMKEKTTDGYPHPDDPAFSDYYFWGAFALYGAWA